MLPSNIGNIRIVLLALLLVSCSVEQRSENARSPVFNLPTAPAAESDHGSAEADGTVTPEQDIEDLSDFDTFRYSQEPYEGYCAHPGLFDLRIAKGTKDYLLSGWVLDEVSPDSGSCEEDLDVYDAQGRICVQRRQIEERVLAPSELEVLISLFQHIPVDHNETRIECEPPCGYENYQWDGYSLVWEACLSPPYIDYQFAEMIRSELELLVGINGADAVDLQDDEVG